MNQRFQIRRIAHLAGELTLRTTDGSPVPQDVEAGTVVSLHTGAPLYAPVCPKCGDNRQVWVNQVSGLWKCHRAFCDTTIDAPLPGEAPPPTVTDGLPVAERVYLGGPMTGLPGLNFPAFHAAAARLRAVGYDVVNPAELNTDHSAAWEQCLRKDIAALAGCDTLALLPGWERSDGAHLELHVAHRLRLRIATVADLAGDEAPQERAHRIANVAAEELVRGEGSNTDAAGEFSFAPDQLDEHTEDCIEHLAHYGLAARYGK